LIFLGGISVNGISSEWSEDEKLMIKKRIEKYIKKIEETEKYSLLAIMIYEGAERRKAFEKEIEAEISFFNKKIEEMKLLKDDLEKLKKKFFSRIFTLNLRQKN